jgi:hypothetical protein
MQGVRRGRVYHEAEGHLKCQEDAGVDHDPKNDRVMNVGGELFGDYV